MGLTTQTSQGLAFEGNQMHIQHGYPDNPTTLLTILHDGKIGIGKTNPQSLLHVSGDIKLDTRIWSGSDDTHFGELDLYDDSGDTVFDRNWSGGASDFIIKHDGRTQLIIKENDTVSFGIPANGANNNGSWLRIEGNTGTDGEGSGRIFFTEHNSSQTGTDAYGLSIGYRGGQTAISTAAGNTWTGLSQVNNGEWGFWGHSGSNTGTLVMRGNRQGDYVDFIRGGMRVFQDRVGIGTTNPSTSYKLDVNGIARVGDWISKRSFTYGGQDYNTVAKYILLLKYDSDSYAAGKIHGFRNGSSRANRYVDTDIFANSTSWASDGGEGAMALRLGRMWGSTDFGGLYSVLYNGVKYSAIKINTGAAIHDMTFDFQGRASGTDANFFKLVGDTSLTGITSVSQYKTLDTNIYTHSNDLIVRSGDLHVGDLTTAGTAEINIYPGDSANWQTLMMWETPGTTGMGFRTHFNASGEDNGFSIYTKGYSNEGDKVTFKVDGRVGIGNTDPDYKLHVEGAEAMAGNWSKSLKLTAPHPVICFAGSNGNTHGFIGYDAASSSEGLSLCVAGDSDDRNTSILGIKIDSTGDVGIGTSYPKEKLEVQGKIISTQEGGWTMYDNGNGYVLFENDAITVRHDSNAGYYGLVQDDFWAHDVYVRTQFKTTNDGYVGVILRAGPANPQDNCLAVVLRSDTNNVRIHQRLSGSQTYPHAGSNGINGVDSGIDVDDGQWHELEVWLIDDEMRVNVDGVTKITARGIGGNFVSAADDGMVGLTSYLASATTAFKNFYRQQLTSGWFLPNATEVRNNLAVTCKDTEEARVSIIGSGAQGTGDLRIGQSDAYAGGMLYNGDDNPARIGGGDDIMLYRRHNSVDSMVMRYRHDTSDVDFASRVGIGTGRSIDYKLDVAGGAKFTGEAIPNIQSEAGVYIGTSEFNSDRHVSIVSPTTNNSYIDFSTTDTDFGGRILYNHNNDKMNIYTNTTTRMTLDGAGNVGIGTQSPTAKFEVVGANGQLFSVVDDMSGVIFSVNDSSGIPSIEVEDDGTVTLSEFGGRVNVGTPTTTTALMNVGGTVDAVSFTTNSDRALKHDIKPIKQALDKVQNLGGYTFKYNNSGKESVGVIAQEVEQVFPQLVTGKEGEKSVSYGNIVGLLIEAIKEQQQLIDTQNKRIESLERRLK